jgi:hypothetical protein
MYICYEIFIFPEVLQLLSNQLIQGQMGKKKRVTVVFLIVATPPPTSRNGKPTGRPKKRECHIWLAAWIRKAPYKVRRNMMWVFTRVNGYALSSYWLVGMRASKVKLTHCMNFFGGWMGQQERARQECRWNCAWQKRVQSQKTLYPQVPDLDFQQTWALTLIL